MRSEKLKQLVKERVNLKFRIKDAQQFKEIQDFMFALDVFWVEEEKECLYLDEKIDFLTIDNRYDNIYALICVPDSSDSSESSDLADKESERWFKELSIKEFSIDEDCLVE